MQSRAARAVIMVTALFVLLLPLPGRARAEARPRFVRAIGSPAGLGALNGPMGVTYAPGEDPLFYVVDTGNARVQAFRPSGDVVGMFGTRGNGDGQFWLPVDIAATADGRFVYVVDRRHRRVMQFAPDQRCLETDRASCFVRQWGGWGYGPGQFQEPMGIAVDRSGLVYVADWGAHVVQVFDPDGSWVRTIGKPGEGRGELFRPTDVAISPEGEVWVTDRDNGRISIFTTDGSEAGTFKPGAGMHYPTGIDFSSDGSFVVLDYEQGFELTRVGLYDSARKQIYSEVLGGNGRDTAHGFQGGAMLPDGRAILTLPYADEYNLVALSPSGERTNIAARSRELQQLAYPSSVAIDEHFFAVVDEGNKRVVVLDPNDHDSVVTVLDAGNGFAFDRPRSVAIQRLSEEPNDVVILVADAGQNQVHRARPDGTVLAPWGGDLKEPLDVSVSPEGLVYVADAGNDRVVRYYWDGQRQGVIGGGGTQEPGDLRSPIAAVVGPRRLVYVIEQSVPRLQAFDPNGLLVTQWECSSMLTDAPGEIWRPVDLAADEQYLYVLENDTTRSGTAEHVRVQVFEPEPDKPLRESLVAVFAATPGAGAGELWDPRGLGASSDGYVVAADSGNNRLQVFHWHPELVPTAPPTATETPTPTPTPTLVPTEVPPTATPVPTDDPGGPAPTDTRPDEPTSTPPATDLPTVDPTNPSTPSGDRQPTATGPLHKALLPLAMK